MNKWIQTDDDQWVKKICDKSFLLKSESGQMAMQQHMAKLILTIIQKLKLHLASQDMAMHLQKT